MKNRDWGRHSAWAAVLPLLLLPPLFWAGNFVIGRVVRADVPPFMLSFGRWLIAFVVLLPFAWRQLWRDRAVYWQHRWRVLGLSLTGVFAFNTLIYKGLHDTVTTNALLLNSCIPVLIMLFGTLFYGQRLRALQLLGVAVSLAGVLEIVLGGDWARLRQLAFNPGDVLVFGAMVCWAVYTLWTRMLPACGRQGLLAVQIALALPVLLLLCGWEWAQGARAVWSWQAFGAFAYIGVLPSVAAYWLYNTAVQRVGAVRAGLSIHLIPLFGVLLSLGWLGETLHAFHVLGIAAIALGLWLSNRFASDLSKG